MMRTSSEDLWDEGAFLVFDYGLARDVTSLASSECDTRTSARLDDQPWHDLLQRILRRLNVEILSADAWTTS